VIVSVPGDKSITQRALILASLARGESRLRGLLASADPRSTAGALRALGVDFGPLPSDGSELRVRGVGLRGLREPAEPIDLGNSGTGTRLLLGVLAGQGGRVVVLDGDASLRTRPMGRVTRPLRAMGAGFRALAEEERLPLEVRGAELRMLEYDLPVASAQVKSALLLAGLTAGVPVLLTEPGASRDHTERMLRAAGVSVIGHVRGHGRRVELRNPPVQLDPLDFVVPGDLSSAAFVLLAGALGIAGGAVTVRGVGMNPTRSGVLALLERMGAALEVGVTQGGGGPGELAGTTATGVGEPTGDITVRPTDLTAITVEAHDVVAAIDEIPVVAAAAVRAEGVTRITGAAELRVKETDRLHALAVNLRTLGVRVEELDDGIEVEGTDAPLHGEVDAFDDHRIAMVFGVLGAQRGNRIRVRGASCVDVSYPGFWRMLEDLRARS
jgi:3-phosphoshikimate 1-carboxyvinyltransferase